MRMIPTIIVILGLTCYLTTCKNEPIIPSKTESDLYSKYYNPIDWSIIHVMKDSVLMNNIFYTLKITESTPFIMFELSSKIDNKVMYVGILNDDNSIDLAEVNTGITTNYIKSKLKCESNSLLML